MPANKVLEVVDRLVLLNKTIIREGNRYKIYLDSRYNDIWKEISDKKKVDVVIFIRD